MLFLKYLLVWTGLLSLVEVTASSPFWHKPIQERLKFTTKESLLNNLAVVLPLDINVVKDKLHLHRSDIHVFPCLFSRNAHYNSVNIGKEQLLFSHRRLFKYWGKQYWFFGGYWGISELWRNTRKTIGGVELVGSRFGQMTINFFHDRLMFKGLSFKYRFNHSNKLQPAIFFSIPWDFDRSTYLVPSRFGVAGRYAITKDWSVELEWTPYNLDASPVFCLRWRYGYDHQIARPALLSALVKAPDYYMPYFVKPTIFRESFSSAQENFARLTGESKEFIKYASKQELGSLYRKTALQYHPDQNRAASAQKSMQELNAAYAVLKG